MAEEKITVNQGENWKLQVDRAGTATLATAGKYVDRNIEIEVPGVDYTLTATGKIKGSTAPVIESAIENTAENSITKAATITASAPASGKYFVIAPTAEVTNTGSATVSVSAATGVTTPGFMGAEDIKSADGNDVNITNITVSGQGTNTDNAYYLPVSELTNNALTASTSHLTGEEGQAAKDNLTVSLVLPAGYYEQQTISKTFEDLLPAIEDDAAANHILYGKEAYDENGKLIHGTMANHSLDLPTVHQVGDGSTSISGTSVKLSETNTSGIAVTATGTVSAKAKINEAGYYIASESDPSNYTSAPATRYVTEISLGENKTLDKLSVAGGAAITDMTNNGSIKSLDGIGHIEELSGSQTIDNLTGTVTIAQATDSDENAPDSPGKVIFKNTTIVKDGELVKSTQSVNGDKVTVSPGWISTTQTIGVDEGAYEVDCEKTNPSIEYKTTAKGIKTTTTNTGFALEVTGEVTPGTHKATATVTTAGYLPAGSISSENESITVTGASTVNTINVAAATFASGLSESKYADNTSVSQSYQFSAATEGYTKAGIKDTIEVFNGVYSWA